MTGFDRHRQRVAEALAAYEDAAGEVDRIEAETLARIEAQGGGDGSRRPPATYALKAALKGDHAYELASARKQSRQRAVIMYALVALVEKAAADR